MRVCTALVLCALWLGATPAALAASRYDPERAGHPLRIAAYALHPVGVILDRLVFRPAWQLGQHEPLRTLFGVVPDRESVQHAPQVAPPQSSGPPPREKP
ncbi:MAG: hypothetical protein ACE5IL_00955 [Myxococcota bacterium]